MSRPPVPSREDHPALEVPPPRVPERGVFLSFEGGDGAGKSTQLALLREHLVSARSVDESLVLTTREPGGTVLGTAIRDLILHGEDVDHRAEALLYAADRAHHVHTVVAPHLARGGLVLADRYLDSSIAYQGAGRELDPETIAALSLWATGGLLPHRTILLDVPPHRLHERRPASTQDRLERAGESFHTAVREEFLRLAAESPGRFVVIDGSRPPDQVHAQVLETIGDVLALVDPAAEAIVPASHRDEQ